jgi:hypothetical protein
MKRLSSYYSTFRAFEAKQEEEEATENLQSTAADDLNAKFQRRSINREIFLSIKSTASFASRALRSFVIETDT